MSPNKNYLAGRRFEYTRMKYYKEVMKHDVLRTAGSHGAWDLICVDAAHQVVTLIQCKVCHNHTDARRLLKNFRESPVYPPMKGIHQRMEVKVTGSTEVHSVTI